MPTRSRRPLGIAIALASLLLLGVCAANATAAAIRFAAPGGTALASSECKLDDPCSLFNAASGQAQSTALRAGDEVVVESGTYSAATGDLGPQGAVELKEGIVLNAAVGQPRPVIVTGNKFGPEPLVVITGDSVSGLEVRSAAGSGVFVRGGIVDDVIVHDQDDFGTACHLSGGIVRDSVCLATGDSGSAVSSLQGGNVQVTLTLRNVTAIATGPGSTGLLLSETGNAQVTLNAKAVIAEGTAQDVRAAASGAGSSASIVLENSDFDSSEAAPSNGATASATAPGTPTNIESQPLLAGDSFHELATSPTIDKGVTDGSSGAIDIDGQARKIGLFPDIGADEWGDTTRTALTCLPASLEFGETSTCTTTVEDNPVGGSVPGGTVEFTSDQPGSFSDAGTATDHCTLVDEGGGKASCHLTYTPTAGTQSHKINALYQGDVDHDSSANSAELTVLRRTTTALVCAPLALVPGQASTCTATIKETSAGPNSLIRNVVEFTSDRPGSFSGVSTATQGCAATVGGGAEAICTFKYTPTAAGAHKITASYQGDGTHQKSQGSTQIQVTAPTPPRPAPNTTLKKNPGKKTLKRLAQFSFASDQAGSSFQCKLDKRPFKPCRPPFKAKVTPGRHSFSVRAIGSTGLADPTPAVFHWKVL